MTNPGYNEGFHVLDDFVCEAIHAPAVTLANPAHQGRAEEMVVLDEVVFDASQANGDSQVKQRKEEAKGNADLEDGTAEADVRK
jgi:hypothetical protein